MVSSMRELTCMPIFCSPARGCASLLRDGGAEIALIPVAAVPSIPDIRIVTPFCIGASLFGSHGGVGG